MKFSVALVVLGVSVVERFRETLHHKGTEIHRDTEFYFSNFKNARAIVSVWV